MNSSCGAAHFIGRIHVPKEGERDAHAIPLIEAAVFMVPPFVDDIVFIIHSKQDYAFQS